MKKLLLTFLIASTLYAHAQVPKDTISDLLIDSCVMANSLEIEPFYVKDTSRSYWCGYYSGSNFNIGYNLVLYGSIDLANMGNGGHIDLSRPAASTAFLGIPNVTKGVYKDSCGRVWYDGFCNIYVKDKCGTILAENHKFYYGVATNSGYAIHKTAGGTFQYTDYCNNYISSIYGEIDTLLAYSPAVSSPVQATLPANYFDIYSGSAKNGVLINNNELKVGESYYFVFVLKPFMVNQGANLGKDSVSIPFTFLSHPIHAKEGNPNGYYVNVAPLEQDAIPATPSHFKIPIVKGQNQTANGELITWDAMPGACYYSLLVQTWLKGSWHTVTGYPKKVYGTAYPVAAPQGSALFSVSAINGAGASIPASSNKIMVK